MKITSLEIKQHEFEKSFRGYDIEEVNNFLSNIASEWDRVSNEVKMLKMQLEIAEKEASKLREVEMTLIKTLRTAEDTSSRITENASTEANKKIEQAELRASQLIADAENQANNLIQEAKQKATSINLTAKEEFEELENNFLSLESSKQNLLNKIQTIASEVEEIVAKHKTSKFTEDKTITPSKSIKLEKTHIEEVIEEIESEVFEDSNSDDVDDEVSFSSAINNLNIDEEEKSEEQNIKTNLELIEGIGPKIKEVLNGAKIFTFRDLATTPIYRIKDILSAAGSHLVAHDPTTWVDQALLAEEGRWEQLEELKEYLIAGRTPIIENKKEPLEATRLESTENSTEEMLDKVNKVKAAIRKAMVDKSDVKSNPDSTSDSKKGGSFFDNLN